MWPLALLKGGNENNKNIWMEEILIVELSILLHEQGSTYSSKLAELNIFFKISRAQHIL
jgi:hypothetical protein